MEESNDIRMLLDGLEVSSIAELRKLVDGGRLFLVTSAHDCGACLSYWSDERAVIMTDHDLTRSRLTEILRLGNQLADAIADGAVLTSNARAEIIEKALSAWREHTG